MGSYQNPEGADPLLHQPEDHLRDHSAGHHEDQTIDAALNLRHLPLQVQTLRRDRPELRSRDATAAIAPISGTPALRRRRA